MEQSTLSERLMIPPGMINNTVVALSKDRMCTVFWDEKTMSFESIEIIYTVATIVRIAPPASAEKLETLGVSFVLAD